MRSKMLGLAIALSTFSLGVAATTAWLSLHSPSAVQVSARKVIVLQLKSDTPPPDAEESAPCPAAEPSAGARAKGLTVHGGILNGKAISRPAPAYPPIARAARASGAVIVMVKVDECGNVIAAKAVSGHPLLQQAAAQAAYRWRFTPTLLSGQPVSVTGTITFDFLLQ